MTMKTKAAFSVSIMRVHARGKTSTADTKAMLAISPASNGKQFRANMHFQKMLSCMFRLLILLERQVHPADCHISSAHRVCTLCQTGNLGDEQHLVFQCSALQGIRDRYNGLFGDHAATMVHPMWQHGTRAVAKFIEECMDAHDDPGPQSQASDQP